jgi:hypothetical protein
MGLISGSHKTIGRWFDVLRMTITLARFDVTQGKSELLSGLGSLVPRTQSCRALFADSYRNRHFPSRMRQNAAQKTPWDDTGPSRLCVWRLRVVELEYAAKCE